MKPASARPYLVLVQGAFVIASCWSKVISLLQSRGVRVIAVQSNMRSLEEDSAAVLRAIDQQQDPVLLVGHGWGGSVISQAGNHPLVCGLVFIAAAAPDTGQSFNHWQKGYFPSPGSAEMRPYGADGYVSLSILGFLRDFGQDLCEEEISLLYALQNPFAARALDESVTVAAWRKLPTWYAVAANDRFLSPILQIHSARRMHATTLTLSTGHLPMLSQPEAVAAFLLEALASVL